MSNAKQHNKTGRPEAVPLLERARRYVDKCAPAIDGQGGCHKQTFLVATALVKGFALDPEVALPIMRAYNARCQPEWTESELVHKLVTADKGGRRTRGYLLDDYREKPGRSRTTGDWAGPSPGKPASPAPEYDPDALRELAGEWATTVDVFWLANRSATDPAELDSAGFLKALYGAKEHVLCFSNQMSQGQALWPKEVPPMGGPDGVWFLPQPVDGKYHPNPRSLDKKTGKAKRSRRSEESVSAFRYLVLESDEAPAKEWLGVLVQAPLRIEAIYTSGRRSVHALVRVDCPTKPAWDEERHTLAPFLNLLTVAGVDRNVLTAVRLSRLPQALRGNKRQRLLYLCPNAPLRPLCELPVRRDTEASWLKAAALGIGDADETGGQWLKDALRFYAPASPACAAAYEKLEEEA